MCRRCCYPFLKVLAVRNVLLIAFPSLSVSCINVRLLGIFLVSSCFSSISSLLLSISSLSISLPNVQSQLLSNIQLNVGDPCLFLPVFGASGGRASGSCIPTILFCFVGRSYPRFACSHSRFGCATFSWRRRITFAISSSSASARFSNLMNLMPDLALSFSATNFICIIHYIPRGIDIHGFSHLRYLWPIRPHMTH